MPAAPLLLATLHLFVGPAAAAPVVGRDFQPYEVGAEDLVVTGADGLVLYDAIYDGGSVKLLLGEDSNSVWVGTFDETTGTIALGAASILTADTTSSSLEEGGIRSAQIAPCVTQTATDASMTYLGGNRWAFSRIGVDPSSATFSTTFTGCHPTMVAGSRRQGFYDPDSGARTTDSIVLSGAAGCGFVSATYSYTTCSFSGTSAWYCPVHVSTPTADGDEVGACRYFMLYEGNLNTSGDIDSRLLVAYSATIEGIADWRRWWFDGSLVPTAGDERIASSGPRGSSSTFDGTSFASVPTLTYDTVAGLWRVWFVTNETGYLGLRYTESDDDGHSWGIGGGSTGAAIDCWSGTAPDTTACAELDYDPLTPYELDATDTGNLPEIVDPEVVALDVDSDGDTELGMMFTGSGEICGGSNIWGSQLWQYHEDWGDDSLSGWTWSADVGASPTLGIIATYDLTNHCDNTVVMDPEIVSMGSNRYLIFWNVGELAFSTSIYWGASGYPCSDFADNDTDTNTDYPADTDCVLPTDTGE